MRIRRSLQARTRDRPASVNPPPVSGELRETERHAVREDVFPAPDESERAQPRRVQDVEGREIGVDGFGTLDVQHGGDLPRPHGGADLRDRPADREIVREAALEPEQDADHAERRRLCGRELQQPPAAACHRRPPCIEPVMFGMASGGGKTGEEPAGKSRRPAHAADRCGPRSPRLAKLSIGPGDPGLANRRSRSLWPSNTGIMGFGHARIRQT